MATHSRKCPAVGVIGPFYLPPSAIPPRDSDTKERVMRDKGSMGRNRAFTRLNIVVNGLDFLTHSLLLSFSVLWLWSRERRSCFRNTMVSDSWGKSQRTWRRRNEKWTAAKKGSLGKNRIVTPWKERTRCTQHKFIPYFGEKFGVIVAVRLVKWNRVRLGSSIIQHIHPLAKHCSRTMKKKLVVLTESS